jgi:hypothetical protein
VRFSKEYLDRIMKEIKESLNLESIAITETKANDLFLEGLGSGKQQYILRYKLDDGLLYQKLDGQWKRLDIVFCILPKFE